MSNILQANDVKSLQWVDGTNPPAAVTRWDKANGEPSAKKYVSNECLVI